MSETTGLQKLTVVNLGLGMAPALVCKLMAEMGATTYSVALEDDPFIEIYPACGAWRANDRLVRREDLNALLANADLAIIGGESYPGLDWNFAAEDLAAANPQLVILEIGGLAHGNSADIPAVEILLQAQTGLVYEIDNDRPTAFAMLLGTYGAAVQGLVGALAALVKRAGSRRGEIVYTSLEQGILMHLQNQYMSAEHGDAQFDRTVPPGVRSPIIACANDEYITIAPTPGTVQLLYDVLGIKEDPVLRWGMSYFGDIDLYEQYSKRRNRDELLNALWSNKLAADAVLTPEQLWREPQTVCNGIVATTHDGRKYVGETLAVTRSSTEAAGEGPGTDKKLPDNGPLTGLRVIDFGHFVAGPYAGELLCQLGADVIKIEPHSGDAIRLNSERHILVSNAGKRSLAIDLKKPAGLAVVRDLCRTADVMLHNFRHGVAARMGLDPHSLQALNPRIVTLELSAFGTVGPKAATAGFDPIMQGYCGHGWRAGGDGNPPLWYRLNPIDYTAGALGAIGILAALVDERLGGSGAHEVQTDLLKTGMFLQSELLQKPDGGFEGALRLNCDRTGFHPSECLYETADGWIALAVRGEEMASRLAEFLDVELGPRAQWSESQRKLIGDRLSQMGSDAALAGLRKADIWAAPCTQDGWARLLGGEGKDPSGMLKRIDHPRYGQIAMVGELVSFAHAARRAGVREHAPVIGEDSAVILQDLGYDEAKVRSLFDEDVVRASTS